jgi:hypothetical protein
MIELLRVVWQSRVVQVLALVVFALVGGVGIVVVAVGILVAATWHRSIQTPVLEVTGIIGAHICVIARKKLAGHAKAFCAHIHFGANIIVGTRLDVVGVDATQ